MGRRWEVGRLDQQGCSGSYIGELHVPVILGAALWGVSVHEGLASVQGPPCPLDETRWMPRQQCHRAT